VTGDSSTERLAAIVVHDVAPATWPQCEALLRMIDALGAPPVTLLVVPHFHGGVRTRDCRAFVEAMDIRRARGDELVLHGFFHFDDAPAPRSVAGFVARRILTRGEAEFAAVSDAEARDRLQQGIALFHDHGWPLHGFVPPAWQLNAATRRVLDASPHRFQYVPVKQGIHRLPGWTLEPTANYCYSPDRRWRRLMSRAQIAAEAARRGSRRLLRLSLHPLDAQFDAVIAHWQRLIITALTTRRAVTKHQAMTVAEPPRYADMLTDLGGKLSGT
jgi:predicted deacetylase